MNAQPTQSKKVRDGSIVTYSKISLTKFIG